MIFENINFTTYQEQVIKALKRNIKENQDSVIFNLKEIRKYMEVGLFYENLKEMMNIYFDYIETIKINNNGKIEEEKFTVSGNLINGVHRIYDENFNLNQIKVDISSLFKAYLVKENE